MDSPSSSTPPDSPFQRIVNYPVWSDSDDEADGSASKDFGLVSVPTSQTTQELFPANCSEQAPDSDSDSTCDEETASPAKRSRRYAIAEAELPSRILELLKQVKEFFTKPLNLERFGPAISTTTHNKARERIRCYLGFLRDTKLLPPSELNSISVFQNDEYIQDYLNWLDEKKRLQPGTTALHTGSLLYVLKYLHRDSAPKYKKVSLIAKLRRVQTDLQKEAEVQRPRTSEELQAVGKWLSWQEILDSLCLQRQRYEVSRGLQKSKEMMDLVLIATYSHLPPSRGLEIRTLQYFAERTPRLDLKHFPKQNILALKPNGDYVFHFQSYKTAKFTGHDQVCIEVGEELHRLLGQYLKEHRDKLLVSKNEKSVFVNSKGAPFSSSSFSKHLQGLFSRLTGSEISINCLRSSFITHAYSQENCSDSMKSSLASALRHSKRQAQDVYDRRTAMQKKNQALEFARNCIDDQDPSQAPCTSEPTTCKKAQEFKPGQFVALVQEGSTLKVPKCCIGRVMFYTDPSCKEVQLLWYKNVKGSAYKLELDGSQWVENTDGLIAVELSPSKKIPDQYTLLTAPRTLHKKVFTSD